MATESITEPNSVLVQKVKAPDAGQIKLKSSKPKSRSRYSVPKDWKPHPIFALINSQLLTFPPLLIFFTVLPSFAPTLFSQHTLDFTQSFFKLSYLTSLRNEDDQLLYTKGRNDFRFVAFYIIVIVFLRQLTMQYAFKPFAKYMGTKSSALRERFCEQAWFSIYYSTFFSIGLYLAYHSPYWLRTEYFWVDYPHMHYTGLFKSYYLLQLSFSLAQIVVLHLEKPRKDYVQFLVHHLLTIGLVSLSYYMNFTRIGNAIFITMDFADIFLSTAKCLKYIKFQKLCDAMFVLFVVAWIFSRHFVYIGIVQSIYTDVIAVRPLIWKPEEGMYMSYTTACVFVALFAGLKILILYWGWLIMKVVVKVVTGKGAEDNRSDGEESDDENVEIKDSVSTNSENQTANKSQCSPNSHLKQKEE